jgi:AcrR family transcriptional regulator
MGKQERIPATRAASAPAAKPARAQRGKAKTGDKAAVGVAAATSAAPAPPGRNKRSEETIKQIFAAAEQVILESGVERVAIQDVCEVAGLSRGTFYRYFSSQDELLDAFSKHKRARFHLALTAATAPYLVPEERFTALIAYLDNYLKHSKARRLLEVAPEFAFGFFQRIFHDSLERFQDVLGIVFDSWDARLGVKLDRALICEMLIRYVLSELLVPREGDRRALLASIAHMTAAIAGAGTSLLPSAPTHQSLAAPNMPNALPEPASAPPPGRNKRSEETILQILIATEQVILESGVDRVSIQAVCEAAGISRGTFYRYFKAQDELLEAFTQHKRAQFHQALIGATSPHADPDQRFAALISHLDRFLTRTKARRLLTVAPEYAFGFFQRAFLDSLDRFQDALAIVFDAWDERLGVRLDRALVCEMMIRYVLSELLVQGGDKRHQLPQRVAALIGGIGGGRAKPAGRKSAPARLAIAAPEAAVLPEAGRNKRSDQTIAQILTAAEEVILESGVERVSILAVCEAAGISRGTFYRYFSSQEQLLDAFTQAQHVAFHRALVEAAAPHSDPQARFEAVIGHMDRFLRRDKVRRLIEIAPDYAFGFFQRTFEEAIAGFEGALDIVFDAWEERLDTRIDRHFACELLVRYMLSELLVPTDAGTPLLPLRLGMMFGAVLEARGR